MKKFLSRLTSFHELIIVLSIAFGWAIYSSNVHFLRNFINPNNSGEVNYHYNNFGYLQILIIELIIIGLLAAFLELRNWKIKDFSLKISLKAIGAGFLLLFLNYFLLSISLFIPFVSEIAEGTTSVNLITATNISIPLAILSGVVINPFFEELFLIGYLGKWFEKYSPVIFILISTLIRVSYHTYQGYFGMYSVAVIGLISTLYFLKYRNLTPVIVTHMLYNLGYYLRTFYFNESQ